MRAGSGFSIASSIWRERRSTLQGTHYWAGAPTSRLRACSRLMRRGGGVMWAMAAMPTNVGAYTPSLSISGLRLEQGQHLHAEPYSACAEQKPQDQDHCKVPV